MLFIVPEFEVGNPHVHIQLCCRNYQNLVPSASLFWFAFRCWMSKTRLEAKIIVWNFILYYKYLIKNLCVTHRKEKLTLIVSNRVTVEFHTLGGSDV